HTITESALAKAAAIDLKKLGPTATPSQRRAVLWRALNDLIAQQLLTAEAEREQRTPAELIQDEVDSDLPHPPDPVVEKYYEYNKAQFPGPRNEALEAVRRHLFERTRRNTYDAYIQNLGKKYGVKTFIEPLRVPVATSGYPSRGPASAPVTIVEF